MATVPNPADYATGADFWAAYREHREATHREQDAALLATLAELGARTTDCPCGYTPFDSCPACD